MANKKTSRKKTTSHKESPKTSFRGEVLIWCMLAICILLFLSNFGIIGVVGNAISSVSFGLFGILAYIFPIILFLSVAFAISNQGERKAVVKLIAGGCFLLFLAGLIQLIADKDIPSNPLSAFLNGFQNRAGGGFFGGIITGVFCPTIGKVGAYVVTIIALIISVVLFTGRSAISGIKKGSKKVYDKTREGSERVREARSERRQLRMEKKAQAGVSFDTKLKKQEPAFELDQNPVISDEITALSDADDPNVGQRKKAAVFPMGTVQRPSDQVRQLEIEPETEPEIASGMTQEIPPLVIHQEPVQPEEEVQEEEEPQPEEELQSDEELLYDFSEEVGALVRGNEVAAMEKSASAAAEESMPVRKPLHKSKSYVYPSVSLLTKGNKGKKGNNEAKLQETAQMLEQVLDTFGVKARVTDVSCGPTVTRYELQPDMGVKVSRIVGLADDLKLNLAAADIRIEAPIPGKAAVGIEVPNQESTPVFFRELVESAEFKAEKSRIAFGAGKDIGGKVIVADIAKMPHVLIAGATGSGKSVCINTIIMSILYRADPEDVKLIMIDPKVVELSVYNGIPHLLIPVVTDPKKAAGALHWAVQEMTDRYQKFAEVKVRKIEEYNDKIDAITDLPEEEKPPRMPQIVVIVDELADLMMVAPGDVEDAICRLAQLARACGIHLVIATQRPSVNVITGLIKANMPSRIAFAVTSGVDSRTILDMVGAEKLLGKGDMLFYPQGLPKPLRVQGAFVSDQEVQAVVSFLKEQNGETVYDSALEDQVSAAADQQGSSASDMMNGSGDGRDEYFLEAARLIIDKDKASIGMLQRYFKIGFNRAARIMDQLEDAGVVGPEAGTKPREILMSAEQLENYLEENG